MLSDSISSDRLRTVRRWETTWLKVQRLQGRKEVQKDVGPRRTAQVMECLNSRIRTSRSSRSTDAS